MKITKDQARILADAMRIYKHENMTLSFSVYETLTSLEDKLENYSKDSRRIGRTTKNDFNDCLKRLAKKQIK
jgi:hypothetical protein